jgi:hypothetical protein
LPAGMKITTYNDHLKAPSLPASSSSHKEYCVGRGLRSYPINPLRSEGWEINNLNHSGNPRRRSILSRDT